MDANNMITATTTVKPKGESDCLSDKVLAEISRRLSISVPEKTSESDIWSESTEPANKSLIWWPIDPLTKARVGVPKAYDLTTATWVPLGGIAIPQSYLPRKRRNGASTLVAGSGTFNASFETMGTKEYFVKFLVTSETASGSGVFNAAPAAMNNFAILLTARTETSFSAQVFNVPTGGATIEWEIAETATEALA